MSSEAWGAIGTRLSASLGSPGSTTCEEGYATSSGTDGGALTAAIDDYARANGPTDELVAQVAAAAKGDLILTVTVAGRPPVPEKVSLGGGETSSAGIGRPGGLSQRSGTRARPPADTNALDIAASFFSVTERRSVAEVTMEYTGETVEDALTKFASKLAATMPRTSCAGWDWRSRVDAARIRRSMTE